MFLRNVGNSFYTARQPRKPKIKNCFLRNLDACGLSHVRCRIRCFCVQCKLFGSCVQWFSAARRISIISNCVTMSLAYLLFYSRRGVWRRVYIPIANHQWPVDSSLRTTCFRTKIFLYSFLIMGLIISLHFKRLKLSL